MEAKTSQKKIHLSDSIGCVAKATALITLKDNKDNFQSSLHCRLINPSKSKLGKISQSILENINQYLVKLLCVNQQKNSASDINGLRTSKIKKTVPS